MTQLEHLRADPLPWLLSRDSPAVRAAAMRRLLDMARDAPPVRKTRAAAMHSIPDLR